MVGGVKDIFIYVTQTDISVSFAKPIKKLKTRAHRRNVP